MAFTYQQLLYCLIDLYTIYKKKQVQFYGVHFCENWVCFLACQKLEWTLECEMISTSSRLWHAHILPYIHYHALLATKHATSFKVCHRPKKTLRFCEVRIKSFPEWAVGSPFNQFVQTCTHSTAQQQLLNHQHKEFCFFWKPNLSTANLTK